MGKEGHPIGEIVGRLYNCQNKAFKVAATVGARKFLTLAYHVLAERRPFAELWSDLENETTEANHTRKLKDLGKRMAEELLPLVVVSLRKNDKLRSR